MKHRLSKEHKEKIGLAHKGKPKLYQVWNKGKHWSKEIKEKLSKARLGKKLSLETRKKMSIVRTGKKKSLETRAKVSGKNHYNWKGGITKLTEQIRKSFEYRQWRSDIFTRDNWVCQTCNVQGGKLNVHHTLKSFSKILEDNKIKTLDGAIKCKELWNLENGITLCFECHKLTDNYLNKKSEIRN